MYECAGFRRWGSNKVILTNGKGSRLVPFSKTVVNPIRGEGKDYR